MSTKGKKLSTPMEPYHIEELNRHSIVYGNKRNIDHAVWINKLGMISVGLLIFASVLSIVSAIGVVRQPYPEVYVSTVDGYLIRLDTWTTDPALLDEMMESLEAEDRSLKALKGGEK